MEGANRQYRKVSGPAAEVKEGFVYSTEMSATGVALAAKTSVQPRLSFMVLGGQNIGMWLRWSAGSFLQGSGSFRCAALILFEHKPNLRAHPALQTLCLLLLFLAHKAVLWATWSSLSDQILS